VRVRPFTFSPNSLKVVARLNDTYAPEPSADGSPGGMIHIGILDLPGFENLPENALDQLFINLAAEQLQEQFNASVAQAADLYSAEGASFATSSRGVLAGSGFPTSEPVLALLAQPPYGCLPLLEALAADDRSDGDDKFAQVNPLGNPLGNPPLGNPTTKGRQDALLNTSHRPSLSLSLCLFLRCSPVLVSFWQRVVVLCVARCSAPLTTARLRPSLASGAGVLPRGKRQVCRVRAPDAVACGGIAHQRPPLRRAPLRWHRKFRFLETPNAGELLSFFFSSGPIRFFLFLFLFLCLAAAYALWPLMRFGATFGRR
jgi:hypothetical protein